jgi:hypothetical protein
VSILPIESAPDPRPTDQPRPDIAPTSPLDQVTLDGPHGSVIKLYDKPLDWTPEPQPKEGDQNDA